MKAITITGLLGLALVVMTCNDDRHEELICPAFEVVPESPYDDPVWHPSGDFIGFNHRPIKEIKYSYGQNCPRQASYIYEDDSIGFYFVNVDGTNKRMVLPYRLLTPAWSPDGQWIAFANGGQIFKMPFDGTKFDTTAIEQLTFEGENFYPSWSPDGQWIAYDSNKDSPTGLSFVWKMSIDGSDKIRIAYTPTEGETRMPDWIDNDTIIFKGMENEIVKKSVLTGNMIRLTDVNYSNETNSININPKFNQSKRVIAFLKRQIELHTINTDGSHLKKITNDRIINFSWSPTGQIVYVKFNNVRLDETNGSLWVMDAEGENQQPLTYNKVKITIPD